MPELETINLIDGQPVSEFGYLTYQFWKSELKQTLFLVVFSLSLFFGALSLGGLAAITYIESISHCEVKAYGSTP